MRDQRALSSASVAERYLVAASHMPLPLPHPFGGCSPRTTVKTPCRYRAGMLLLRYNQTTIGRLKAQDLTKLRSDLVCRHIDRTLHLIGCVLLSMLPKIARRMRGLLANARTFATVPCGEQLAVRRHCRAEARDGAAFRLLVWCWRDRSGQSRDRPLEATWHCKHRCFTVWSLSS